MVYYKLTVGLIGCKNTVNVFPSFIEALQSINKLHPKTPKKLELIMGKGYFDKQILIDNR